MITSAKRPLVTAVMITGMHRARYSLARIAIRCFCEQTYPEKELLIINHGTVRLTNSERHVREILVQKRGHETVGDLRNIGLAEARGDFVITWDDDDWYSACRIEAQMSVQAGNAAVALKTQIRLNLLNSCALYQSCDGGFSGTLLHPRDVPFRYPSQVRGSDTVFLNFFKGNLTILNNEPLLYIRIFHGLNLWDGRHIMHRFANPEIQGQFELKEEHTAAIRQIMHDNAMAHREFHLFRTENQIV
jgi:glycosyltransferase involved in cell wall biosynthesis